MGGLTREAQEASLGERDIELTKACFNGLLSSSIIERHSSTIGDNTVDSFSDIVLLS